MRNSKLGLGLLAAAAMMVMAFGASSASATTVEPAGEEVVLQGEDTRFIPANAYAAGLLTCNESEAEFTIPSEAPINQNENNPGVGTWSTGSGSVSANLGSPTFDGGCKVTDSETETETIANVTVTVSPTQALWISFVQSGNQSRVNIAIAQRQISIVISAGGVECEVDIAPEGPAIVSGEYDNETEVAAIDGQVEFEVTNDPNNLCAALGLTAASATPSQFEGSYEVVEGELQIEA